MRVKNVTIGIKRVRDVLDDAGEVMELLERGGKVTRRKPALYFENIDVMRKATTTERLRLLTVIKEQHPSSINELAKMLDRKPKPVSADVRTLSDLGLIEMAKGKANAPHEIMPVVRYEKIRIEIAV